MQRLMGIIIKKRRLIVFSFLAFLFVHIVKLVNYLPTHDSMYGLCLSWTEMLDQGRWLGPVISNLLTTVYDLQWVEGLFSALFVSLTIAVILDIFRLTNKVYEYVSAALFVAFPSITALLMYEFWSAATTFSLFLAVYSVLIIVNENRKIGMLVSTLLLLVSLGIYQMYIFVAASMIMFWSAYALFQGIKARRDILCTILRFAGSAIVSLFLYMVITQLVLRYFNVEMSSYQGLSSIGILSVEEYLNAAVSFMKSFILFFIPITGITTYGVFNILFIVCFAILLVSSVLMSHLHKTSDKWLIIVCLALGVLANYILLFVSSGVSYHACMEIGNFFIYLFLFVMMENSTTEIQQVHLKANAIKKIGVLIVAILVVINFQNANICYKQQEIRYSRTNFEMTELLSWIDEINEYDINQIAITGKFAKNNDIVKPMQSIVGARVDSFITHPYHFVRFASYYYGRSYTECSEDILIEIKASDEYQNMPEYPNRNCVQIIQDTIVIKLPD